MKDLEKILKALANKRRLGILQYLKKTGEAPVTDIASSIRLSFRATSRHLTVLSAADILDKEQRGLQIFYKISTQQKPPAKRIIDLI